ncbi:hypothetical protein KAT92_00835, partial [Candidatus Babeliales bacterium]|nr:hypothetical protein [Candidatus Babeliales bacterium]
NKKLEDLLGKVNLSDTEKKDLESQVDDLKRTIFDCESNLRDQQSELDSAKSDLATERAAKDGLADKLLALNEAIDTQKKDKEGVDADLNKAKQDLNVSEREKSGSKEQILRLEAEKIEKEKTFESRQKELEQIKEQLLKSKTKDENLETELLGLNEILATNKKENEAFVAKLETAMDEAEEKVATLEIRHKSLETKISDLEAKKLEQDLELANLNKKVVKAEEALGESQKKVSNLINMVDSFGEKISALHDELDETKEKHAMALEGLQGKLDLSVQENVVLNEQIKKLEDEKREQESALETAQDELARVQRELGEVREAAAAEKKRLGAIIARKHAVLNIVLLQNVKMRKAKEELEEQLAQKKKFDQKMDALLGGLLKEKKDLADNIGQFEKEKNALVKDLQIKTDQALTTANALEMQRGASDALRKELSEANVNLDFLNGEFSELKKGYDVVSKKMKTAEEALALIRETLFEKDVELKKYKEDFDLLYLIAERTREHLLDALQQVSELRKQIAEKEKTLTEREEQLSVAGMLAAAGKAEKFKGVHKELKRVVEEKDEEEEFEDVMTEEEFLRPEGYLRKNLIKVIFGLQAQIFNLQPIARASLMPKYVPHVLGPFRVAANNILDYEAVPPEELYRRTTDDIDDLSTTLRGHIDTWNEQWSDLTQRQRERIERDVGAAVKIQRAWRARRHIVKIVNLLGRSVLEKLGLRAAKRYYNEMMDGIRVAVEDAEAMGVRIEQELKREVLEGTGWNQISDLFSFDTSIEVGAVSYEQDEERRTQLRDEVVKNKERLKSLVKAMAGLMGRVLRGQDTLQDLLVTRHRFVARMKDFASDSRKLRGLIDQSYQRSEWVAVLEGIQKELTDLLVAEFTRIEEENKSFMQKLADGVKSNAGWALQKAPGIFIKSFATYLLLRGVELLIVRALSPPVVIPELPAGVTSQDIRAELVKGRKLIKFEGMTKISAEQEEVVAAVVNVVERPEGWNFTQGVTKLTDYLEEGWKQPQTPVGAVPPVIEQSDIDETMAQLKTSGLLWDQKWTLAIMFACGLSPVAIASAGFSASVVYAASVMFGSVGGAFSGVQQTGGVAGAIVGGVGGAGRAAVTGGLLGRFAWGTGEAAIIGGMKGGVSGAVTGAVTGGVGGVIGHVASAAASGAAAQLLGRIGVNEFCDQAIDVARNPGQFQNAKKVGLSMLWTLLLWDKSGKLGPKQTQWVSAAIGEMIPKLGFVGKVLGVAFGHFG